MKIDRCLRCGAPMWRGTICENCGTRDTLGRVSEVSKGIGGMIFALLLMGFFAIITIAVIWSMVTG